MDTLTAIFQRHSIGKVKPDPLQREIIEQLLSAAVQAPNHHKVYPWRFIVLSGAARERLGDVMAESMHQRFPQLPPESLGKERAKPLRAPVVIAAAVEKNNDPRVIEIENIAAVAAACQNILLTATNLGLGAILRTGDSAYDPRVKEFLGLEADQHLLGFIYVGYPETTTLPPARPGFEDKTTWMD